MTNGNLKKIVESGKVPKGLMSGCSGPLKNRILHQLTVFFKYPYTAMENHVCSLESEEYLRDMLWGVIDEAKKDMGDGAKLADHKEVLGIKYICIEQKKWLKWFGDSS